MEGRFVSVIIPNFNNASWLPQCLDSCIQQPLLKEIIVVDDHSTDKSWDILKNYLNKYPTYIKVFKNPDKGANHARNFGFEKATGNYIQWLDSDDILLPGKFEQQIKMLEQENADVAYSDFRNDYYENESYKRSEIKKSKKFNDFTEEILKDNWLACHSYLLRRKVAESLAGGKGWNPLTRVGQDREYFTMAALTNAKFVYVPGCFAVYNKWCESSISGMEFGMRLQLNQLLETRFEHEIINSERISKQHKKKYLYIINTHTIKAFFYNSKIPLRKFIWPWAVRYKLMHWKMASMMPFIFFKYYWCLLKGKDLN